MKGREERCGYTALSFFYRSLESPSLDRSQGPASSSSSPADLVEKEALGLICRLSLYMPRHPPYALHLASSSSSRSLLLPPLPLLLGLLLFLLLLLVLFFQGPLLPSWEDSPSAPLGVRISLRASRLKAKAPQPQYAGENAVRRCGKTREEQVSHLLLPSSALLRRKTHGKSSFSHQSLLLLMRTFFFLFFPLER